MIRSLRVGLIDSRKNFADLDSSAPLLACTIIVKYYKILHYTLDLRSSYDSPSPANLPPSSFYGINRNETTMKFQMRIVDSIS
jgi:hypothetical protein